MMKDQDEDDDGKRSKGERREAMQRGCDGDAKGKKKKSEREPAQGLALFLRGRNRLRSFLDSTRR